MNFTPLTIYKGHPAKSAGLQRRRLNVKDSRMHITIFFTAHLKHAAESKA